MKTNSSKIVLAIIMLSIVLTACEKSFSDKNENLQGFCIPDSLMKNITLDTVKSEPLNSSLKLTGKITFNEEKVVKVYPLVSGYVVDVKVALGDYVTKGQVLAFIQSSEMANFSNEFKDARSELTVAKKNMEVTAELRSSGVSSEKDYLEAQSEYNKAQAAFDKINEVMKIYGSSKDNSDSPGSGYTIKSPINGFIVERKINAGMELRSDDSNNLFTISDLKEVWAVANVYESDISKIKSGSETEITTLSYPDKIYKGKVEQISNILDPETNSMIVKIRLSNSDYSLKPGMFANISILYPEKENKLVVSSKSVLFDDNNCYVVLFRKRCDVCMQSVKILKSFNDKIYIQSDSLQDGDKVINRNGLFVFTALKKL